MDAMDNVTFIDWDELEAEAAAANASLTVPLYVRITTSVVMSVLLLVGISGNVLVPIVIAHSKDLRNSTNVFLVNLALADLLVILICLPTGYIELFATPGVWYLGETMCLVVTFVDLIAPHASVLTILAISFERYYAICQPFKAGYICTKSRAMFISLFTWICAGLLTSPILALITYDEITYDVMGDYERAYAEPQFECGTNRTEPLVQLYYSVTFSIFFLIPCVILMVLYVLISQHLIREPTTIGHHPQTCSLAAAASADYACDQPHRLHSLRTGRSSRRSLVGAQSHRHHSSNQARRQVVAMLGAVVVSFFVCLLPFRMITLMPDIEIPPDAYFAVINFCRIMAYLNSAINPILYNLMSSKFRGGFLRLFGLRPPIARQGTVNSSSLNTTSSSANSHSHNHSHGVVVTTASLVSHDATPLAVRNSCRMGVRPGPQEFNL